MKSKSYCKIQFFVSKDYIWVDAVIPFESILYLAHYRIVMKNGDVMAPRGDYSEFEQRYIRWLEQSQPEVDKKEESE